MTLLLEGLLLLALILVPSILGMLAVDRFLPPSFRHANREASDPVWAIAGGAFGLLLGFMVVNLWDDLQRAQATVQDEANDLMSIHQLTFGLPDSAQPQPLRDNIRNYARLLVDEEWEALGRHESSPRAEASLDQLWKSYLALEPALGTNNASYQRSLNHLGELQDARNRRINAAKNVVPLALWVVLVGGVAVMIMMIWFTGSEDFRTHLLTTVVLSVSLASILFLIRAFNNPFQGQVRADPEPIERALEQFQH